MVIKKGLIPAIGAMFIACAAMVVISIFCPPAHAGTEQKKSVDYREVLREAAQVLREKGIATAKVTISAYRNDLAQHKVELINELGKTPFGSDYAVSPLQLALGIILEVRDLPAVLKRAEADRKAAIEAEWVLCELAGRSIIAEEHWTHNRWRAWWKANKYRLDLDPADCKRRALAAAPRYGGDENIQKLIDRMETTYRNEAWDISWALDRIARYAVSKKITSLTVASPFMESLRDGSVKVRWSAAHILKLLQDPRTIEPLMQRLQSDASEDARIAYIEALESIGKPSVPALIRVLETLIPSNGRLRAQKEVLTKLCEALGKIGDPSALPALREALSDPINEDDSSLKADLRIAIETLEGK
jgi:hypothetical protein